MYLEELNAAFAIDTLPGATLPPGSMAGRDGIALPPGGK